MLRFVSTLMLVVGLLAVPAFADFKLEKGASAPEGIPAALKDLVQAQGVRVLNDAGAPYAEIWLHKALAGESKPPGADVIYTGIPEGSFLGVWRFVAAGSDFRGQQIKPGLYSMRYALIPADGNHLGASQYRDFVLLVPAAADQNPASALKFEEIVPLSRKASGTGHPAVFPMVTPENVSEPTLTKHDNSWILKAKLGTKSGGGLPVAITVFGRAEQ